ncbi:MAG: phenylacetate-CoA oxygenase subunit PaaJ [Bacteroidetes bacterium]|nr:phenylacetate-CoA oxygenase subunit PaaJ [Bacteroidota bacterium]MDA0972657.1 phenylacetate-CoA oxygenase subunit PaaJ [Bacteroidota bacterium]
MVIPQPADIAPEILAILETVHDPEVPVLTVMDMGIMRKVEQNGTHLTIHISPTYSGCPAMDTIADDLKTAFSEHGFTTDIELVLAPAWTTDDMSEAGKRKLEEYGIASPLEATADKEALMGEAHKVKCPRCGSTNTHLVSAFGSTACKAHFKCKDCLEPFDYFKCLK